MGVPQIDLGEEKDCREHGEPAERSNRVAVATPDFGEAVARAEARAA